MSDRPVALVTGAGWWPEASPGLGWAVALELGRAGHHAIVADKELAPAECAAADLRQQGLPAEALAMDVTDAGAVMEAVTGLAKRLGRIDVLVNAAALTMHKWGLRRFHEITTEQCDLEMNVTLRGALNVTRATLPHMLERRAGNIVFVASVLANEPAPRQAIYGLSKAALVHLTRSLAAENGPAGIRVNCVCPGIMKTRVTDKLPEKYMSTFVGRSALGRISEPREVAQVIAFLVSAEASYVNGVALPVDGGAVGAV